MEKFEINNENVTMFGAFTVRLNEIHITYTVIELIIGFTTVIGALTVLMLFYHERKTAKISHKYFTAMAIGDLLQGIITPTVCVFFSRGLKVNDKYCFECFLVGCIIVFTSMFLLISMSIDRYIAIMHPIKYKSFVTKAMTYAIITGCFIGGFIVGIIVYLSEKPSDNPDTLCFVFTERTKLEFNIAIVIFIILPCVLGFLYIYIRIYHVIMDAVSNGCSDIYLFRYFLNIS